MVNGLGHVSGDFMVQGSRETKQLLVVEPHGDELGAHYDPRRSQEWAKCIGPWLQDTNFVGPNSLKTHTKRTNLLAVEGHDHRKEIGAVMLSCQLTENPGWSLACYRNNPDRAHAFAKVHVKESRSSWHRRRSLRVYQFVQLGVAAEGVPTTPDAASDSGLDFDSMALYGVAYCALKGRPFDSQVEVIGYEDDSRDERYFLGLGCKLEPGAKWGEAGAKFVGTSGAICRRLVENLPSLDPYRPPLPPGHIKA